VPHCVPPARVALEEALERDVLLRRLPEPLGICRADRELWRGGVRKTPSWPRSWANFSPLQLCSYKNAWANLHILGQTNAFLARGRDQSIRVLGNNMADLTSPKR
jgi:hypothetical protein